MFIGETHIEVRAREMINNIYPLDELLDDLLFGDIAANQFQTRVRCLLAQQLEMEIDRSNIVSMFDLAIHQVTSDKAACAGNQDSHARSAFRALTITALLVRAGSN
jgi:hypothetical protein